MSLSLKDRFKKLNKKKKIILSVILLTTTILCLLLPLKFVYGDLFGIVDVAMQILDIVMEATMTVLFIAILVAIVVGLSNVFLAIGASLLAWAVTLNTNMLLTRCEPNPLDCIVGVGWAFARDLANMFFILALTFIAFATILGIETYGMKKMIVPLVLIALTINFSQLFMGIIVDFASGFMQVFTEPILNWMDVVGQSLQAQFSIFIDLAMGLISPILALFCPICGIAYTDPMTAIVTFFIKIFLITAYNVLAGVMFLILAGIFILRVPMMWILTILAPMGLVCYLFPFLRSKYRWWLKQVGQWAFIGLFALFFIYLGSRLWETVWSPNWEMEWGAENFGTGFLFGDLGTWFITYILPGAVFLIFLFLALQFVQQSSAIFAGAIIGAGVAVGRQLKGRIEGTVKGYAIPRLKETAKVPQMQQWVGEKLRRVPVAGELLKPWREKEVRFGDAARKELSQMEKFSFDKTWDEITAPDATAERKVAGIAKILEKHDLDEVRDKGKLPEFERLVTENYGDLKRGGFTPTLKQYAPQFAYLDKSPEEKLTELKKYVERNPEKVPDMQNEALKDPLVMEAVLESGTPRALTRLGRDKRKKATIEEYLASAQEDEEHKAREILDRRPELKRYFLATRMPMSREPMWTTPEWMGERPEAREPREVAEERREEEEERREEEEERREEEETLETRVTRRAEEIERGLSRKDREEILRSRNIDRMEGPRAEWALKKVSRERAEKETQEALDITDEDVQKRTDEITAKLRLGIPRERGGEYREQLKKMFEENAWDINAPALTVFQEQHTNEWAQKIAQKELMKEERARRLPKTKIKEIDQQIAEVEKQHKKELEKPLPESERKKIVKQHQKDIEKLEHQKKLEKIKEERKEDFEKNPEIQKINQQSVELQEKIERDLPLEPVSTRPQKKREWENALLDLKKEREKKMNELAEEDFRKRTEKVFVSEEEKIKADLFKETKERISGLKYDLERLPHKGLGAEKQASEERRIKEEIETLEGSLEPIGKAPAIAPPSKKKRALQTAGLWAAFLAFPLGTPLYKKLLRKVRYPEPKVPTRLMKDTEKLQTQGEQLQAFEELRTEVEKEVKSLPTIQDFEKTSPEVKKIDEGITEINKVVNESINKKLQDLARQKSETLNEEIKKRADKIHREEFLPGKLDKKVEKAFKKEGWDVLKIREEGMTPDQAKFVDRLIKEESKKRIEEASPSKKIEEINERISEENRLKDAEIKVREELAKQRKQIIDEKQKEIKTKKDQLRIVEEEVRDIKKDYLRTKEKVDERKRKERRRMGEVPPSKPGPPPTGTV